MLVQDLMTNESLQDRLRELTKIKKELESLL